MGRRSITTAIVGTLLAGAPIAGIAQTGWVPGSEIIGQSIQVETNGVTNTVFFDPGGVARIRDSGRQYGPGNLGRIEWTIVPVDRRRSGMLALCPAVPVRTADHADEQLQFCIAVDCARHEPGAPNAVRAPASAANLIDQFN